MDLGNGLDSAEPLSGPDSEHFDVNAVSEKPLDEGWRVQRRKRRKPKLIERQSMIVKISDASDRGSDV